MDVDVFVSVGRTTTDEQETLVQAVERCLRERGLRPHTLGRSDWSSAQPLRAIEELMRRCSGTAVIAFERLRIDEGTDLGASGGERALSDERLPTTWNQIEATMAYALGHPLLVLAEEGLLESRYDWMVQWTPLDPDAVDLNPCRGMVEDWKQRVLEFHARRRDAAESQEPVDLAKKSVGDVVGMLRPGQLYALAGSSVTVLGGAFALGAAIGG